jgi:predicted transcriptional regulator
LALTQVQSLLGTKNAVTVALQVNAASQANAPSSATGDEGAKPDSAVASALQIIARHADSDSDRRLAADALQQITCGRERWDLKTLSDAGAPAGNAVPKESSIAELVAMGRPSTLAPDVRDPLEKYVFKVLAKLVSVKQEPDRDYRLIIADDSGRTMVAEIPSPDCYKGGDPTVAAKFADARQAINQIVGLPPGRDIEPPTPVQVAITGIAFFDVIHGQHGMAPNGIELHPVLGLRILDSRSGAAP